jgi:hypothetical protein
MRSALFSLLFVSLHCAGLELYCEGEWDSGRTRQEFLITVDPASGFMWGFEPLAAIGFFDVDDKKNIFSKDFKCNQTKSSFDCRGSNRVGYSTASLNRYSGRLETTTLLKNETTLVRGQYTCKSPPTRKF